MHKLENASLFDLLRTAYQIEVTGGVQHLYALKANKELQEYFQVKAGHPVLQLNRKIETNRPGMHIYSKVFCNTQEYALFGTF
jgi:DNA-binding GntR family transcriptional regulator